MNRMSPGKNGFTLIELLTVMGIIAVISVIALVSYSNMARGSSYLAMRKNIQGAVMLARQHASLMNRPVHLLLTASGQSITTTTRDAEGFENTNVSYLDAQYEIVTVYEGGVATAVTNNWMYDSYAEPYWFEQNNIGASMNSANAFYIYNMDAGKRAIMSTNLLSYVSIRDYNADPQSAATYVSYPRKALRFTTVDEKNRSNPIFSTGDAYGIELSQPYRLPRGFEFANMRVPEQFAGDYYYKAHRITFYPDGHMDASDSERFRIKEVIGSRAMQVTVKASGFVEVEDFK